MSFLFEYFGWKTEERMEDPKERAAGFAERLAKYNSIRLAEREFANFQDKPKTYFANFKTHPMYEHNARYQTHVQYTSKAEEAAAGSS